MTFLPIVRRELRVRAREPRTYWLRLWVAAGAFLIAALLLSLGRRASGGMTFAALSWLALFYCFIEGPRVASDCISAEKRDGTLGLLFLTDLRGFDVVLGKFIATSLNSFYGLIAFLPILALSIFAGGVTLAQYTFMALALGNCLFFTVTASLLISTVSVHPGKAWGGSWFLISIGVAGPVLVHWLVLALAAGGRWLGAASVPWTALVDFFQDFARLSPLQTFIDVVAGGTAVQTVDFLISWGLVHALSWIFLALASVLLPRTWQEKTIVRRQARIAIRVQPEGRSSGRAERRGRLLDLHPIAWLVARDPRAHRVAWMLALVGLLPAVVVMLMNRDLPWQLWPTVFLWSFKVWVVWTAARTFQELRRNGGWELMFSTPMPAKEMVRGHLLGLRKIFLGPIVVLALGRAGVLELVSNPFAGADPDNEIWPRLLWILFGLAITAADFVALTYMGMWQGTTRNGLIQATVLTLLYVWLLPMLLGCIPRVFLDVVFILWTRDRLLAELRVRQNL